MAGRLGRDGATGTAGAARRRRGFGSVSPAGDQLTRCRDQAARDASQRARDGQATDPTAVVMAVERAQLSMQLASQLRTKGVEALNDIFHTQV